jgi:hypothetical protein
MLAENINKYSGGSIVGKEYRSTNMAINAGFVLLGRLVYLRQMHFEIEITRPIGALICRLGQWWAKC